MDSFNFKNKSKKPSSSIYFGFTALLFQRLSVQFLGQRKKREKNLGLLLNSHSFCFSYPDKTLNYFFKRDKIELKITSSLCYFSHLRKSEFLYRVQ